MDFFSLPVPKMDLEKYQQTGIPAVDQVRIMEDSAFEDFIGEWLYGCKRDQYSKIQLVGGAGDKGRDAICTRTDGKVDYYQCKHYASPLTNSNFTVELGKLCYYTFSGDIPLPRKYYIVASKDIGPKLKDFLDSPELINRELINYWDERCKKQISRKEIPLNEKLKDYIHGFDFGIVEHYPIQQVIDEHLSSIYGCLRFGTPTVARPKKLQIPTEVTHEEQKYIKALFEVYSSEINQPIHSMEDLKKFDHWFNHLTRQRRDYFAAEAIRRAVRDIFTDSDEFRVFKDEIYDGIIDRYEEHYSSSYIRMKEVLMQASIVSVQKSLLASKLSWIGTSEKKGACHMLVNDGTLKGWGNEEF